MATERFEAFAGREHSTRCGVVVGGGGNEAAVGGKAHPSHLSAAAVAEPGHLLAGDGIEENHGAARGAPVAVEPGGGGEETAVGAEIERRPRYAELADRPPTSHIEDRNVAGQVASIQARCHGSDVEQAAVRAEAHEVGPEMRGDSCDLPGGLGDVPDPHCAGGAVHLVIPEVDSDPLPVMAVADFRRDGEASPPLRDTVSTSRPSVPISCTTGTSLP